MGRQERFFVGLPAATEVSDGDRTGCVADHIAKAAAPGYYRGRKNRGQLIVLSFGPMTIHRLRLGS
jgi:hypothetical protein